MAAEFYGEKYEQLVAATPAINDAGFGVPDMYGISQSTIDSILFASSLPSLEEADKSNVDPYDIEDKIVVPLDITEHWLEHAQRLAGVFNGPLVLRSSGKGDAIGIGVYASAVFSDNKKSLHRAFKEVVASYFDKPGVNYRQRANIASGFGVFMQPLVGTAQEGASRYEETTTAPFFDTLLSGNAKLGTPRSPKGIMRLQPSFGCAVAIPGLPYFDFEDTSSNEQVAVYEASEAIITQTGARNRGANDAVSGTRYVNETGYGWRRDYGEFYLRNRTTAPETLTIGALKEHLSRIHSSLGGHPVYLEFVVRSTENTEELYVVQKGDIVSPPDANTITIDTVNSNDILLSNMVVEAGSGNSPVFNTIVCLTDEDKSDLYAFDETEAAKGGYLLVFGSERSPRSNPINLRRLKNVKAIVTIESMGASHTSSPEEHVIGYSETLRIPLISIYDQHSDAWQLLNGWSWAERRSTGRHEGSLLIRDGSFQVVTDSKSKDGLILKFNR